MPVMGGPALAHALHAWSRHSMLIMVATPSATITELRAYGVRAWLAKPLSAARRIGTDPSRRLPRRHKQETLIPRL